MTNQQERDWEADGVPGVGPLACCDTYAREVESLILSALDDVADGSMDVADETSRKSIQDDIALKLARALVHIRSAKRNIIELAKEGAK